MASLEQRLKNDFPNLQVNNHKVTSPQTSEYNCIAWAAGDDERWWWPAPHPMAYWPPGFPRTETIENFIAVFATFGYEISDNSLQEPGFEKVVLYANNDGKPTHMARQLESGAWTSKLGQDHDIEHEALDTISGPIYGVAVKIFRRAKK
ncbi:DUF7689 domain-containing protein [Methylovulum miyakonense]|uniref:DUF7689 domain-containing protein n=1 Tax=Methylovulum miyakonense TaxID=645578 RepID=UPI00037B852F|nr:hypothetical protein [Methylovulum miyakonense]